MNAQTPPTTALWPLAVYFLVALILTGGMMGLSYILGQRHKSPQSGLPFESGVEPVGSARVRWNVKYYLVAMFFVIFDLEAVFLFAWAVAARELGWPGYIEAVIFVAILLLGLVYLWRVGALDWGTQRRKAPHGYDRASRPVVSPVSEAQTWGEGSSGR